MKKLAILLIAGILTVSIFSGCETLFKKRPPGQVRKITRKAPKIKKKAFESNIILPETENGK